MDDSELTERLARDLDGTFEHLVEAHVDRCYSIALRVLGNPHDAEEVAQDALVRAYRALGGYGPQRIRELRLRAWLATRSSKRSSTRMAKIVPRAPARAQGRHGAGGGATRDRYDRARMQPHTPRAG